MDRANLSTDLERRKHVRVRMRGDLAINPQKYEGRTYYVVKDPVSLRYYRFKDKEYFLIQLMDGETTLDETQKEFEQHFRPDRLTLEELEGFAQQLLNAGLAHNDSPNVGKHLFDRRKKKLRSEWMQMLTNVLYIKIPVFDPDKVLVRLLRYTRWIFTRWFLALSILYILAAVGLVLTHFETFYDKLPSLHEFLSFKNLAYMWVALGAVKVIHEFGHGLSCKAFGGESHEMGVLFLCLSPCLYCNVSDAWTLPDKWKRIIISFAGIYVELVIAATATFVWWNSTEPLVHSLSQSLMYVCSISTIVFNANPLMRYDGYYILADWLEIPNLRDRSNRFLSQTVQEHCLGIEVPEEQHMELSRRILFVAYAVVSYVYRWVVTFSILFFLSKFLEPYRLRAVSNLLALAAAGSMVGWPLFRLGKSIHKRGRLPDMKPQRVSISTAVLAAVILILFLVPLPVSRVRQIGLVQVAPTEAAKVYPPAPVLKALHLEEERTESDPRNVVGILKAVYVRDGQEVKEGDLLAEFSNLELEGRLTETRTRLRVAEASLSGVRSKLREVKDPKERLRNQGELVKLHGEVNVLKAHLQELEKMVDRLVLRAPRGGVVMTPPRIDEIGIEWDKERDRAFCTIGDPHQLWVVVPVSTADYNLLKEDLAYARRKGKDLAVDLRVHGLVEKTWKGKVVQMPESEAREIPTALTLKAGGPVAVKPADPRQPPGAPPQPQTQQYLVAVSIQDPGDIICPGAFAQVKVHCRWRTCAWWAWRTISSMFALGLI